MKPRASEEELVARIRRALGSSASPAVELSIGDDAAVLAEARGKLVVTVDEQVEGTHFRSPELCSLEDVGFRATMAAASDLAAMGARPLAAVAAWVLPSSATADDVERVARGQRQAVEALGAGAGLVGGNLARGPGWSVATTWLGTCARPVARSGARPGDGLFVSGQLGLAAAGLRALTERLPAEEAAAAWRRPRARIEEGLRMAAVARACIDVSDGLALDASRLAAASSVRVVLDERALRGGLHAATLEVARAVGADPLELALSGGEDYALLCASPSPIEGFSPVGSIEPGEGVVLRGSGTEREVRGGFDHFA